MKRFKVFSVATVAMVVVGFIAFNFSSLLLFSGFRLDATEDSIYTLSEGSENIIQKLEEPIRLKLFYSSDIIQDIPQLHSFAQRIIGLLKQYTLRSDGNIILEIINPEPFSPEEDQAVSYGLQAVPIDDINKVYFGIVAVNSIDRYKSIGFITEEREAYFEYDLTKLVYDLEHPNKPKIGVMSWLPMDGKTIKNPNLPDAQQRPDGESWVVYQQLSQQFNLQKIELDATNLPNDINILFLVHPHTLSDAQQYMLDQFVIKGGKLIAMVDPMFEERELGINPVSNLPKLFKAWGVEMDANKIVADKNSPLIVQMQGSGAVPRQFVHLAWQNYRGENFAQDDIVTAQINQVRIISSGALKKIDGAETTFSPLIQTSPTANLVDSANFRMPPNAWFSSFTNGTVPLTVAARVRGQVKSAFPDATNDTHMNASIEEGINVLIFADADMLLDKYWVQVQNFLGQKLVQRTADNGTMIVNALENMVGNNDLISLRSRGIKQRPFEVVDRLRNEAKSKYQDEEKRLQAKLSEAERKIASLQQNKDQENALILSNKQQREIAKFQREQVRTRQALRSLQLNLNREIDSLGMLLKFINIALIPILILLLSFFLPARLGLRR